VTIMSPNAAGRRSTASLAEKSGQDGCGSAVGRSPTTETPWAARSAAEETTIARTRTTSAAGTFGAARPMTRSSAMLAAPTPSVQPCVESRLPIRSPSCSKKLPLPLSTPKIFGSWEIVTVSPRPKRKPVMTGFETKSMIPPRRKTPATARTAAVRSASAAESAANRAVSPFASGPTAAADSAEVAVVALTTSDREVPTSA